MCPNSHVALASPDLRQHPSNFQRMLFDDFQGHLAVRGWQKVVRSIWEISDNTVVVMMMMMMMMLVVTMTIKHIQYDLLESEVSTNFKYSRNTKVCAVPLFLGGPISQCQRTNQTNSTYKNHTNDYINKSLNNIIQIQMIVSTSSDSITIF